VVAVMEKRCYWLWGRCRHQ